MAGNPAVFDNRWSHFAFIKNGDQKQVWINGALFLSGTNTAPLLPFSEIRIGAEPPSGNSQGGFIDDFAVWNVPLDGELIATLAAGTPAIGLVDAGAVGDVNDDGVVDMDDYMIIRDNFKTGQLRSEGNLDFRGTTDFADFRLWKESFLAAGGAASVPEPSAVGLLLLGAVVGCAWLKKKTSSKV